MTPTSRGGRAWLGAVCMIAFLAWAWNSSPINLKDHCFPKHLARVAPAAGTHGELRNVQIFRSGQISANLIEETLRALRIQRVIDLTFNDTSRDPDQIAEQQAIQRLAIEHQRFPLEGSGRGSIDVFAQAVAALTSAARSGEPVLVHCRAGDRRSGSVLATYKLLVERASSSEARRELERFSRRSPDDSGLVEFLDRSMPTLAAQLVSSGVISDVPNPLPRIADSASHEDSSGWFTPFLWFSRD